MPGRDKANSADIRKFAQTNNAHRKASIDGSASEIVPLPQRPKTLPQLLSDTIKPRTSLPLLTPALTPEMGVFKRADNDSMPTRDEAERDGNLDQTPALSKLELRFEQCIEVEPHRKPAPTLYELKTTYADASESDLNFMIKELAKGLCDAANAGAVTSMDCSSPEALFRRWDKGSAAEKALFTKSSASSCRIDALREVPAEAAEDIEACMKDLSSRDANQKDTET